MYVHHQLTAHIFTLFTYPFFVYCSSFKNSYIAAWLRCKACVYALRMPSITIILYAQPINEHLILCTDCKAVVTVDPAYDVQTLEEGDYKYLRKAIQNARKNKKTNPHRVMQTLYHHTYHRVVNITANYGAERFRDIMVVARTAIKLRLVKGDIRALDTADTVADVLDVLHDDEDWKDTRLLEEIVNYLPEDARVVAVSLLD